MPDMGGGMFFLGGDGEDIPPELRELLQNVMQGQLSSGLSHDKIADEFNPTVEQYALGPGDLCLLALTGLNEEKPAPKGETFFEVAEVLDPEEYVETYPDWITRIHNRHVLCRWYEEDIPDGTLGWLPRSRLLPVERWQWDALWANNKGEEILPVPCIWLVERYLTAMVAMRVANPGKGFCQPLACGECGRYTVVIKMHRSTTRLDAVASFPDGAEHEDDAFYSLSNMTTEEHGSATLVCLGCKTECELDMDKENVYFN